ncbi:MAG TPA: VCBS repeat-containing protein [Pirellulales bacterium]|nr:VCBS repeat-containing protein [Pirellulales bacterium]
MKQTGFARRRVYGGFLAAGAFAAGLTLSARGDEPGPAAALSEPTPVEVGGTPIDIEQGGLAPYFGDFDGDGLPDLFVGQFDGKLRIYPNRGTRERPRFDDFQWFKAGAAGEAAKVFPGPNDGGIGGSVGFVPQLVDFEGDGLLDVLSCTGNGAIVVFRRRKDGSFAEGESLKRADGLEIVGLPGAAAHAADWDGDGGLDLVVPVQPVGLGLLRNTGSRRQPTYGPAEAFTADDDPVYTWSGSTAPVMADWDGDGLLDLIVGAGDGSVTYYRHAGAEQATTVEDGKELVPPFFFDEEEQVPKPGRGARPCVCDFDADGRLDLLVGGVWTSVVTPEVKLSEEERAHDAALEKKLSALSKKFSAERGALDNETGSAREQRLAGLRVIGNQMRSMRRELTRPPPKPIVAPHGQVWVYLRSNDS